MKKRLLSLFAVAGLSLTVSAQIEIYVEGNTTNFSGGGVYSFNATGDTDHANEIHFENHSGTSMDMIVSRRRLATTAPSWEDYLCWGHQSDNFGGLCISVEAMAADLYTMPVTGAVTLDDGEYGVLASHITPSFDDPGTYVYRYYIGTEQTPFMDSIDVSVTLTPLAIPEVKTALTVSVHPNPATEYVVVALDGAETATVRMIDVLGNEILKSTINTTKTIDVSEFRNGIYFVIVESKGSTINRKVIVRH